MFEPSSRYYSIEDTTITLPDGRVVTYKRRREVPPAESFQTLAEVTIAQGDRLDIVTASRLGDAQQFWRVCDANSALNPFELTAEPGRTIHIPVPRI